MSAANPILTTPVPTPGLLLPRSNRGQPDRITNAITQKYAQALVTDIGLPGMPASQLIEQPAAAGGPAAYSITGAVTLSLTPSASMLEGRGILGAVPLTLTLAATMLEGRVRAGAVTLALTPAAVMVFSGTTPVPLPAVGGRPRRHARRRRVREPSHQALWGFVVLALTPHARFARIRDPLWTALPAFLDEDLDEDERLALTVADQWLN